MILPNSVVGPGLTLPQFQVINKSTDFSLHSGPGHLGYFRRTPYMALRRTGVRPSCVSVMMCAQRGRFGVLLEVPSDVRVILLAGLNLES